MKKLKGFTLVELLIVITLMGTSMGIVIAWTLSALDRAELQASTESFVGILRRQQLSAMSSKDNLPQGIHLNTQDYITFSGNDYASSSTSTHESFDLPAQLQISSINLTGGGTDLLFQTSSGETDQDGTIVINHTNINESYTVSITPLGLIDWQ